MLKMMAHGEKDGKPVTLVFFGLSYANLDRLRQGHPIRVQGDTLELPGVEIMIFAGVSESIMQREIVDLIGPETQIRIDPRLKD